MKMKRWIAACVASIAGTAAAQDASILSPKQMEERAAQFIVFVPPEYPKALAAAGVASEVDVFGEVAADGMFQVRRVASSAPNPEFEQAVRDVSKLWTLRPIYGTDCLPRPGAPTQVRIWFEMKDGKPVISFGQARSEITEGKPLKVVQRRNIVYPPEMLRRGVTGSIEFLLRVSPAGLVEEIEMVPGPLNRLATREVATTVRQWRFEPRPENDGPACAVYTVDFGITGGFGPAGRRQYPVRADGAN
jgi:TonB family protein